MPSCRGLPRHRLIFEGVFLSPAIALVIYLITLLLPRIDPGRLNYAQFRGAYLAIRLSILLFLGAAYLLTQLVARAGQNMSKAARLASIDRTTLYRLMEKHGFRRDEFGGVEE